MRSLLPEKARRTDRPSAGNAGDQDYPIYHHPDVQRVIANGASWAAPRVRRTPQLARFRAGDYFTPEHPSPAQRFDGSEAAPA
jgi:trehalose utilization protein